VRIGFHESLASPFFGRFRFDARLFRGRIARGNVRRRGRDRRGGSRRSGAPTEARIPPIGSQKCFGRTTCGHARKQEQQKGRINSAAFKYPQKFIRFYLSIRGHLGVSIKGAGVRGMSILIKKSSEGFAFTMFQQGVIIHTSVDESDLVLLRLQIDALIPRSVPPPAIVPRESKRPDPVDTAEAESPLMVL